MPCKNAYGSHKLKLVVIGKSKKPRSFKATRAENFPARYYHQRKGLEDQIIFNDWFEKISFPKLESTLNLKIYAKKLCFFLCHTLGKVEDANADVNFLPPNVSALIQPMKRDCFNEVKI